MHTVRSLALPERYINIIIAITEHQFPTSIHLSKYLEPSA